MSEGGHLYFFFSELPIIAFPYFMFSFFIDLYIKEISFMFIIYCKCSSLSYLLHLFFYIKNVKFLWSQIYPFFFLQTNN